MTVPRTKILARLNSNVDDLLGTISGAAGKSLAAELFDPFSGKQNSGDASPFLKSLFPEIRIAAIAERSLNTALGWGWDKVVADVAAATHGNAVVGHHVVGHIPATTSTQIEAVVSSYTSGVGHASPDTAVELQMILPGVTAPGAKDAVDEKDDVYYVDSAGVENHVEIKTPKPNYDQMKAAKRRILRIHAVRAPQTVQAFVGMAYNPNGLHGTYGWPTTKYFLDPSYDLKVGKAFWDYVGASPSTYEELLDCFYTVSRNRRGELAALMKAITA